VIFSEEIGNPGISSQKLDYTEESLAEMDEVRSQRKFDANVENSEVLHSVLQRAESLGRSKLNKPSRRKRKAKPEEQPPMLLDAGGDVGEAYLTEVASRDLGRGSGQVSSVLPLQRQNSNKEKHSLPETTSGADTVRSLDLKASKEPGEGDKQRRQLQAYDSWLTGVMALSRPAEKLSSLPRVRRHEIGRQSSGMHGADLALRTEPASSAAFAFDQESASLYTAGHDRAAGHDHDPRPGPDFGIADTSAPLASAPGFVWNDGPAPCQYGDAGQQAMVPWSKAEFEDHGGGTRRRARPTR